MQNHDNVEKMESFFLDQKSKIALNCWLARKKEH